MNLSAYVQSLFPSFAKSRIVEDIAVIRKTLVEDTIPPIAALAKTEGKSTFKSDWAEKTQKHLKQELGSHISFRGNYYTLMHDVLEPIPAKLDSLLRLVDRYFANDVLRDAFTTLQANILQYIQTVDLVCTYSRRLALATACIELNEITKGDIPTDITPAEFKYLDTYLTSFIGGVKILHRGDAKKMEDEFSKIPELRIQGGSVDEHMAVSGGADIDPFNFGLIPVKLNPIYHIRLRIANYQAARYEKATLEREALEFKLMQLRRDQSTDPKRNPALEKSIDYTMGRLEDVRGRLADMEEEYGLS